MGYLSLAYFSTNMHLYILYNKRIQIIELGPSPRRDTISVNSDFILLEQYYLDRYILKYNVRRIALGPAPVLNPNSGHSS